MNRIPILALAVTPLLTLPAPAAGQDAPPQMFFVVQEQVKPSMMMEYEANTKEFIKMLEAAPIAPGSIQFTTISGPEMGHVFVVPIAGFTGLDQVFQAWESAMDAAGREKWMALDSKNKPAVEYYQTSVIALRDDLSYNVANTEISGEMPFRKYFWWYVINGKEQELEAVAKEYAAMYKRHDVQHGFRIYQSVMGPEQPMYLVVQSAKSEAEFAARSQELMYKMGDEGMQLQQRALKVARRVEIQEGMVRPDLSFPRPTTETGGSH